MESMKAAFLIMFLVSFDSSASSQSDSCAANLSVGNLIPFNTSSLTCVAAWTSEGYILRVKYIHTGAQAAAIIQFVCLCMNLIDTDDSAVRQSRTKPLELRALGAGLGRIHRDRVLHQRKDGRQQRLGRVESSRSRRRRGGREAVLSGRVQLQPVPAGPGQPAGGAGDQAAGVARIAAVPRVPAQHRAAGDEPDLCRRAAKRLAVVRRLFGSAQEHGFRDLDRPRRWRRRRRR